MGLFELCPFIVISPHPLDEQMLPTLVDRLNRGNKPDVRDEFSLLPAQDLVEGIRSFLLSTLGMNDLSLVEVDDAFLSVPCDHQGRGQASEAVHLDDVGELDIEDLSLEALLLTDEIDDDFADVR